MIKYLLFQIKGIKIIIMIGKRNNKLKLNSQYLRKNMTYEERKLWYEFLKDLPLQFYRQRIIENYIVDFYCPSAKLVIEIDGSQHYEEESAGKDKLRDARLSEMGITVIRYSNLDIKKNFSNVCQDIFNRLPIPSI